ncbi:hypothetical protein P152DRAFT_408130 [Eremomyces bilateralis CBS 781.70]|uniref:Metallo-hydrolase/oxidoreductase n=1 Tax=Eremomyces bilateralis CBS 781.70 TaxID=1392243 RepID=A0A6G1GHE3_9PEZI|nr:uncharacterized protein P152DRAFT_408130 [Eremomyces bilateralis CBS 781.70]KAF1817473.1 hypothetical protein P152DRAFT_408130 [Eremomyces bilateralis CBS 781.70]
MATAGLTPEAAPRLNLPKGVVSCTIAAINTTCDLTVPIDTLCEPSIDDHNLLNLPTIAFLITHQPSGRQVLFDLGCRKDFWNLPLPIAETIKAKVPGIRVDKNLIDVLVEGGSDIANIEAAILSHHHYDHIGHPSTFPKSLDLIVGPGFSEEFLPGYPTITTSPFFENDFDRNVRELDFSGGLIIVGFRAIDYFEDGSLYLLDSPGHAVGHISALVRTTDSIAAIDTFVFLGGDICHFGGSFRATRYLPMPYMLSPYDVGQSPDKSPTLCCTQFTACHPQQENARTSPYYKVCSGSDSWYENPPLAQQSIEKLKVIDADDRVLVLIAHDLAMLDVISFFPKGTINDWHNLGWKQKLRWRFLNELPVEGNERKEVLVNGTYVDGKRVKDLDGKCMQHQ